MKEKFVNIEGSKIRYLESGSSDKTLVLIHGLGASCERWGNVLPIFENDFKVIVPDLIGFGYSDKPTVDYTIDFFSNFLGKFLKSLAIEKTSLIGSSLGGQIAAEYTSANPNKVEKLIITLIFLLIVFMSTPKLKNSDELSSIFLPTVSEPALV